MRVEVINDKVLATDSGIKPSIKLGEQYNVVQNYTCKCGQEHLDIGLDSNYNYISCYKCGEELPDSKKIHWCNSTRFNIVEE